MEPEIIQPLNAEIPLQLTPDTEWEEVSKRLEYLLMTVLPVDGELLSAVYDYDPLFYQDLWPALAVFQSDGGNIGQRHNELFLPNVHRFTIRALYPVLFDNPDEDGQKVAQDLTRHLLSMYLGKLWKNPRLNNEVEMIWTPNLSAIQIPGEAGPDLRGWEAPVEVKVH